MVLYKSSLEGVFMDIYTMVSTIFKYLLLALDGIVALVPLYAAGFLIYKKIQPVPVQRLCQRMARMVLYGIAADHL